MTPACAAGSPMPALGALCGSIFAVAGVAIRDSPATAMARYQVILVAAAAALALGCAQKRENVVHVIAEQAHGLRKN